MHALLPTKSLSLIGVTSGAGQRLRGLEATPAAFRKSGIVPCIKELGWRVHDYGDIDPHHCASKVSPWLVAEQVRVSVFKAFERNSFCLTLGGDHSISIGTVRAALETHPDLSVIWIDAHGDMNTPHTSPSGNVHGMPLAALLGEMPQFVSGPYLDPKRLVLIGVRSLDAGEVELIRRLNILVYSRPQVRQLGMNRVMKEIQEKLTLTKNSPVHISLDIDALDPSIAPATGIQVNDGLSLDETYSILRNSKEASRLVSMDLVEVNLSTTKCKSEQQRTLKLAIDCIRAVLN